MDVLHFWSSLIFSGNFLPLRRYLRTFYPGQMGPAGFLEFSVMTGLQCLPRCCSASGSRAGLGGGGFGGRLPVGRSREA
jgi:hypothetical protein